MTSARKLLDDGFQYEKAGLHDRALDHYRRAAALALDAAERSEAFRRLAAVHRARAEWADALEAARHGIAAAREAGLPDVVAEALNAEAAVHQTRGDFDLALPLLEEILATTSTSRLLGVAEQNLGSIAAQQGDFVTAERRFLESHRRFQEAGYEWGEATALNNTAAAALDRGNFALAEQVAREARQLSARIGVLELLGIATLNLAEALTRQDRLVEAEDFASEALGYFTSTDSSLRRVECLRLLGDINKCRGDPASARGCYEAGLRIAEAIDARVEIAEIRQCLAALGAPQP